MQELVQIVDDAARATRTFGRTEQKLIRSAKKKQYPVHFAWNRTGDFSESFGRDAFTFDSDSSARFAIIARDTDHTHAEVQQMFEDVLVEAIKTDGAIVPSQYEAYELTFDGQECKIAIYELTHNTSLCADG